MKRLGKPTVLALLLILLAFTLISGKSMAAPTAPTSHRTVRVGWYNSDHFQEGSSDDEIKNGYSYEYLQSIANFTGWEYEYFYGGWSDCYEAFVAGDIDLLAGVSFTEERAPLMNYPTTEMGFESYYIYKKAGNEEISGSDLSTLSGKKVGTLKNNLMTTCFEEWVKEKKVDCEEVLFDDFQTRDEAFESGQIDAFIAVNNNVPSNSGYSPVVMVGKDSYYLAVTKGRTDLLEELNSTLASISESNPYFTETLQIKYFQNTAVNATLSAEESAWVKERGGIKIGIIRDYMPFCGLDENGNVSGVITDIMETWKEELGLFEALNIQYVDYFDYKELLLALQNGDIDAAFPVTDSIWVSEQQQMVQTNNLVESTVYLIFKGEYTEDATNIIAISDQSPLQQTYALMNFPESEIYPADGAKGCLDAVKEGKATCTFFNSGRGEEFLDDNEYESLSRLSLGTSVNYCFGVKKGNNIIYSLLERGVGLIDKSMMTGAMYKYINNQKYYSLGDFIRDNMTVVLTIIFIIIGLIVLVTVILAISLRHAKIQNEKEMKMLEVTRRQNEELEITKTNLEEAVTKAEAASRAKTAFLFNMSHDIRTPMNAILGFAHMAKDDSEDRETVVEYIEKIESSGEVLLSILNNVLEMSRIEKGTVTLEESVIDMKEFTDTVFAMFDAQMKRKGIRFKTSLETKAAFVYGDETKLREIFLNLLSNACKYTDEGGTVDVDIKELPCEKDGMVLIRTTVKDTGKGMSEEFLPTLFDEFSREKGASFNTIEGTGLGMAIVKRFVELMDGTIEVESRLSVGTTFTLTIPHKVAEDQAEEKLGDNAGSEDYDFSGKRALLAEDMDVNAEIAKALLGEAGLTVERAEDGQICVDMLKEKPAGYYDIILMDIQMPNMDGYEAAKTIRALPDKDKADIPIIAMTANAFEEDRKNALACGMNAHVGKPIVIPQLMTALNDAIGKKA